MIVRRWAKFRSDLPTDEIEGPNTGSDFVQYPGRSVADALAEVLRSLGCDVEPPMHEAGHGWELSIRFASARYWAKVSLAEEYYLRFEDPWRFWWSLMRRHDPVYLDILSQLAAAMRSDDRFRDVRWFTDTEVNDRGAGGAIAPVLVGDRRDDRRGRPAMRPAVFPWAEFTSDLPDDEIEDNGGDFLQYGGKSVAGAIAEILGGLGATVTVPEHRAEHGWDFFATYGGRGVWCQVTLMGNYVFVMKEMKSIFTRGEPLRQEYLELLSRLAEALVADARFHGVRWLAEDQVGDPRATGHARPVNP